MIENFRRHKRTSSSERNRTLPNFTSTSEKTLRTFAFLKLSEEYCNF